MRKRTKKKGTVFLVGAGPGDPDLISVKASRLLYECDAVVYDSLVPFECVVGLPPEVERLYVGKKSADHSLPQEEINSLLVRLAREGKKVVRLKGGDPFVFGRGGEEAGYLRRHGVPYEIVPGITSGIAAPTYAGIPSTDRRRSSFILLLTGHKAAEKQESTVPWEWVAKATGGTIVIFMGVAEAQAIVQKLLDAGMRPDTPAAAIERGSLPTQRTVICPLAQLPRAVKKGHVRPPAVFVIGDVVGLANTLAWFGEKPLSGVRIMVTRPADQSRELFMILRDLGAEVLACPAIATTADSDLRGWKAFGKGAGDGRWLVFTSENGVRYFLREWEKQRGDLRSLAPYRIAALGAGTAHALAENHLAADFVPAVATTASLGREMARKLDLQGKTVVRVRGNLGDRRLEEALGKAGAKVIPLLVYRTQTAVWPKGLKEKVFDYPPDAVLFTSGSTVDGLVQILSKSERTRLLAKAKIFSIGPSTSQVIRSHGMKVFAEAKIHTIQGLVDQLLARYRVKRTRRHA
jgi:uroporphyrinogen III methyltransferase/synthase